MKDPGVCDIENTVIALEEAIENRKKQMRLAHERSRQVVTHLFSEILNRAGQISPALEQGGEFAGSFIKKAQKSMEENPWDSLRKVAIYSFGIGLFLSLRNRKPPAGEKK